MAHYSLHDKADEDLSRLYEYGVIHHGVDAANRYYDGLIVRFEKLATNPHFYQAVDHIRTGYRRSVYGVHSIYYRIDSEGIVIVRVLGQQAHEKLLEAKN